MLFGYLRVSTLNAAQDISLEDQERRLRAYAAAKGQEIRLFAERKSGKDYENRPIFNAMLSELRALKPKDRPSELIIVKLDRFGRSSEDAPWLGKQLRQLGVRLVSLDEGSLNADEFGEQAKMAALSIGAMAENAQKSSRMRASYERRRREGKVAANVAPYGLDYMGGRDVEVPETGPFIRRAFEMYVEGKGRDPICRWLRLNAPVQVVRRLNPDGSVRELRKSLVWDINSLSGIIKNPRYRGTVVSEALFDEAQRLREQRIRIPSARTQEFPLSGCLKCEECGRKLQGASSPNGSKTKRLRYYTCRFCKGIRVNAERVEAAFRLATSQLEADMESVKAWIAGDFDPDRRADASRERELASLERRCTPEAVESRRKATWAPYYSGAITDSQLRTQLDDLERVNLADKERLAALRAEVGTTRKTARSAAQVSRLLCGFWPAFDRATYDQKRVLARTLSDALGGLAINKEGELHRAS